MNTKILAFTTAALGVALSASACMTFVAGKKVSATGRVVVGHNEDDWPPLVVHHGMLPARDWPAGSCLPATPGCCAAVPQAPHTLACYWGEVKFPYGDGNADTFLNERGVLVVSDSGGNSTERMDDPTLLTDGGVKFNLRRAVGERAASARDGVRIIGELVEKYGYAPSARIYTVADADEAWLVQVVHGRNYVAVRCPDDEVTIMPNLYTVYELDAFPAADVIVSKGLVENAKRKGFWDGRGKFNFAKAYQGSYDYGPEHAFEHPNNTGRFRQAIRLLTGEEWPEGKPFPFSVKPAKGSFSVDDMRAVLSAHNGPLTDGKHVLETWSICSSNTIESSICEFAATPRGTVYHLALGRGCEKPYVRLRPFAEPLPAAIDESATAEARLEAHVRPEAPVRGRLSFDEPSPGRSDGRVYYFVPDGLDTSRPAPLLVFLHGGDASSPDTAPGRYFSAERQWLMPDVANAPFIVAAPSAPPAPDGSRWNRDGVSKLIDATIATAERKFKIDRDRIFLGGHSMGCFGAYHLGQILADRFAGVWCSAGAWWESDFRAFLGTPVYMQHGALDCSPRPGYPGGHRTPRHHDWCGVSFARAADELMSRYGVEHVYDEHGGGHSLSFPEAKEAMRRFFAWAVDRRRNPYARRTALVTPCGTRHPGLEQVERSRWLEVVETDDAEIEVDGIELHGPNIAATDEDLKLQTYSLAKRKWKNAARIVAENVGSNRFKVHAENVKSFRIHLAPQMGDLSRPFTVELNGGKTVVAKALPTTEGGDYTAVLSVCVARRGNLDVQFVKDLIAIPSESRSIPECNRATAFLKDYLEGRGVYCHVERTEEGRDALYAATLPGKEHDYTFVTHIDVVPTASPSQYEPKVVGDEIWGRGACDTKVNAALIAQVLVNLVGKASVGAFFATDEDGCAGKVPTCTMLRRAGFTPRKMVLVGDTLGDSTNRLFVAQKGHWGFKLTAKGRGGHSSIPWKLDNAIPKITAAVERLMAAYPKPPEGTDWYSTLAPTILQAGDAPNSIPGEASATFSFRYIGKNDVDWLSRLVRSETGLEPETLYCVPPVENDPDDPIVRGLFAAMQANWPDREFKMANLYGATDAFQFSDLGLPIVIFTHDGAGAHKPDEHGSLASAAEYLDFFTKWIFSLGNG